MGEIWINHALELKFLLKEYEQNMNGQVPKYLSVSGYLYSS